MSEENKIVYLAGDWLYTDQLQLTAAALEEAGYEITRKWWLKEERGQTSGKMHVYFQDIDESEVFVLDLRGVPEDECRKHAGGHIGMGYALAKGKPVLFLGQPASSLYSVCATTTKGLLQALATECGK